MLVYNSLSDSKLCGAIKRGEPAIIRTDTIYGIIAKAGDQSAVNKVYELKQRPRSESFIVLLDTADSAYGDDAGKLSRLLSQLMPEGRPTSVIVANSDAPEWLLRDDGSIAYRVVEHPNELKKLLKNTGPVVAPSANPHGLTVARNIDETVAYFGDDISHYVDGGVVPKDTPPSELVKLLDDGQVAKLR